MTLSDTQHTSSTQLLGCLCVCTPVWPSPKSGYSTSATLRKVSRGPSGHSPLPPPHAQSGLSFPGPQIHGSRLESPRHWKRQPSAWPVLLSPRQVFWRLPQGIVHLRSPSSVCFSPMDVHNQGCFLFLFFPAIMNSAAIYILIQKTKVNGVNLKF